MADFLFLTVTYAGGYMVTGVVLCLSVFLFWKHGHKEKILPMMISVIGSMATVLIIKYFFDLPRPEGAFYTEITPSFPSGHAAIALSLYGFLLYNAWKSNKHHLKIPLVILLFILILLIGISRLYLEVHYLKDVLVGYAIGFLWLLIGRKFVLPSKI